MRVAGIDLGGTHLRAAIATADGTIVAERTQPATVSSAGAFADTVARLVSELSPDGVAAVGVGLPGPVDRDGAVRHLVNVPALDHAPVRALLERRLRVPVAVDNDVNLAALGEQRRGHARGLRDVAFIAIGTGIGMGVLADGRILHGARGGAGELGRLPMSPSRAATDLRALGPLEAVAGGAGLAARWATLGSGDVFAAAEAGDERARALLAAQARALGMAVLAVQALLEPQLIVFGGGLGSRPDVFDRVRRGLQARGIPVPALRISALRERAGTVGAVEAACSMHSARAPRRAPARAG